MTDTFKVRCCSEGGRRLDLGGILVCKHCDVAAKMPRSSVAVEVDEGVTRWPRA
jgi:hypothetical protein